MERLKGAAVKLVPPEKRNLVEMIDAPPDFAEALSDVQAAVQADDATAALAGCRRLVVAYDNLGPRAREKRDRGRRGRGGGVEGGVEDGAHDILWLAAARGGEIARRARGGRNDGVAIGTRKYDVFG